MIIQRWEFINAHGVRAFVLQDDDGSSQGDVIYYNEMTDLWIYVFGSNAHAMPFLTIEEAFDY